MTRLFLRRIFPFRIDLGLELAAADEFLQIANDGPSRDTELPGKGGDVRTVLGFLHEFANPVLSAETIGGAAEQFLRIDAAGAFKGFKLFHDFLFAAFLERD